MRPKLCQMQYIERTCRDCGYLSVEYVSHPGGCSTVSVEKFRCDLGYWEDNF